MFDLHRYDSKLRALVDSERVAFAAFSVGVTLFVVVWWLVGQE